MTVSSTTTRNSYSGNGSTTIFAYNFKVFDENDLTVILRNNATATETVQTLTTHYSVSNVGNANGGNVTFVSAPATGITVVIRRTSAQTQTTDYTPNDPFPAESHEDALDKITFIAQEIQEELDRAIKISRTNTMTSTEFTVGSADRANKVLAFDSSGEIAVTQELGTYKGNWAASTQYYVRDLIKDTNNNNIYICNTAHTSSGSQPITTNTDSAKWTLIVDAAAASSSASAAAASASASASSASASATSASNASTSETNAASSASSASSSASSASSSASAATTAQAAAEAALDTFTDQYLGAAGSDPTTDLDGNALTDGDLYFDTTNNVMKVYDLGTTTWKQLTPTAAQQTNIDTVAGISSDVTSVAGVSGDVTTVAGNVSNVGTVAGSISNVNTVGTNITSVINASNSISSINNFGDTYFVSATAPSSPTLGDLWFDTTNNIMKVYSSGGFVNAGSSVNGTANRYAWTVGTASGTYTGSTTVFPATYDAGYVDVFLNGVKLLVGTDVTATNGTDVTLATAAATNDIVEIVAYGTFTAATALSLGDNEKIQLGASQDLQIYHDGLSSYVADVGTGDLRLTSNGAAIRIHADQINLSNAAGSKDSLIALNGGATTLYYDNAAKIATTATGVDAINTAGSSTSRFGSTYNTGANDGTLVIGNGGSGKAMLRFDYEGTNTDRARIGVSSSAQQLEFYTAGDNKRATLDASGNLLVGKTASNVADEGAEIRSSGFTGLTVDGGAGLTIRRLTSDGELQSFFKDTTKVGSIGNTGTEFYIGTPSGSDGYIRFQSQGLVPCTSTGANSDGTMQLGTASGRFSDLYLSGGVFLGGVGSANYLDDYEEGTWTPQIWKGSTQVTSPTSAFGQYRKIGDVIFYSFYFFKNSGSNTDSNLWNLRGMPFAMETAAASGYTCLTAGYTGINSVNYFNQAGSHRWQNNGSSKFDLYGPQQTTQWTSGHIEFAGYGFVYQA
jgi:hypothetical protein